MLYYTTTFAIINNTIITVQHQYNEIKTLNNEQPIRDCLKLFNNLYIVLMTFASSFKCTSRKCGTRFKNEKFRHSGLLKNIFQKFSSRIF